MPGAGSNGGSVGKSRKNHRKKLGYQFTGQLERSNLRRKDDPKRAQGYTLDYIGRRLDRHSRNRGRDFRLGLTKLAF
jgi:hypothetical protein